MITIILNIIPKPDYFGGYINSYSTPRFSVSLYSLSLISFKLLKETRFFVANREWSAKIKGTGLVISKMTGKHGKAVLLFLFRILFSMRNSLSLFCYRFQLIRIYKMSCLSIPRVVGKGEGVYILSDFICSQVHQTQINRRL